MNSNDIRKTLQNNGIEVDEIKNIEEIEKAESKKPQIVIKHSDKIEAVAAGIIPNEYIDCRFDIEKIKNNQKEQCKEAIRKFVVHGFNGYQETTYGILSNIIARKKLNQSYIIGAPNGFGKTSFVYNCIMKLYANGEICVPYVSLSELAEVKMYNEQRLLTGITSNKHYMNEKDTYVSEEEYREKMFGNLDLDTATLGQLHTAIKRPLNIKSRYSWTEFMNCAVLFCYFTDVSSKVLESEMLKTIITVRGAKGLPTVAMISSSLKPYLADENLDKFVWSDILSYGEEQCYDRVKHVSCYKVYNN